MTARNFMFVCIGLLALAMAYHLGSRSTYAAYDPEVRGRIIGVRGDECVDRFGEAWHLDGDGWVRQEGADLPVPISDVKFLGERILITVNDHGWYYDSGKWVLVGEFPSDRVLPEGETWGSQPAHRRSP
jgi:hypothetical protein